MPPKVIPIFASQAAQASGCGAKGGSGKSSCGSAAGPSDLSPEVWAKVKDHPCYSEQAHHHFARMHIAVAPACNIQCNYCNRKYDCANESRPGVVSEKLTPEMAAKKVLAVAAAIPQLSVVGIAGPGDALANPEKTFRTFNLIQKDAPDIKLCLSTNGLALPDYVQAIADLNVDHVTITINMVDPEVGELIYPWIYYNKKRWKGRDAAKILGERQMEGLEMLTAKGILVKINSVMIPGVNDTHLAEVNRAVKSRGAFLHNIMPLISDPAHGTHYGLTGQRGPTPQELKELQDSCEGSMNLMRHCRQCRADAVGLLGEDRGAEFSTDRIAAMDVAYDPEPRQAYREYVERERRDQEAARESELAAMTGQAGGAKVLAAVTTKGGGRINQHFGHASEFQIYELSGAGAKFVGHRKVGVPTRYREAPGAGGAPALPPQQYEFMADDERQGVNYCQGGWGEEDILEDVTAAIKDCAAVFTSKIGLCPRKDLAMAGIEVVDGYAHEYIEPSLIAWFRQRMETAQPAVSAA
ncbi:nitrogenase cofactor biosynthesis protein NifB [Sulfuricella sp.]|uniref:nitrogenase cofactor biosynthesis protein NifB n=1 Tax=Sulfuricella sp. TaxID=2099377 RepID=UPI002CCFBFA3|nr:nitrogenase cofactor biosynthesis protein NifB [Sulfuricella sp.]HUX64883.1 nitrogenase cofactor biosynthesis protein NifB [Sulfuricella sp.]